MPLPSLFGRDRHDNSRSNRQSTVSPTPPTSSGSGRPQISNPIAQTVHGGRLDPRTTISLVPSSSSASPSPVSAHGSIGAGGGIAADAGGGGGGGGIGNGGVGMEDNTHHSSTSSNSYSSHRHSANLLNHQHNSASNNGAGPPPNQSPSPAAAVTGPPTTTTREKRNPVSSLFSSGRERHHNQQQPPPSPDVSSSVSRRLSIRSHHLSKQQPPSPAPQPSPLQQQHQLGHTQYPPPQSGHQQQHDDNLDPYLQRAGAARQSVLPTPHEEHPPSSLGIDQGQHPYQQQQQQYGHPFQSQQNYSHASLVSQTSHHQQQGQHQQLIQQPQQSPQQQNQYYVDPVTGQPQQGYHQEQAVPPEYQQHHQQQQHHQLQHQQQHQQHSQEDTMPRPSTESQNLVSLSRDVSALSQHQPLQQQQQIYAQRGNVQEAYNGAGGTQGRGAQAHDPNQQQVGRSTPDRADNRGANPATAPTQSELDMQQVLDELTTLQQKYRKVKSLYFDRNAEIERLQNALAHQRLAQSRSSLDDHEYMSRFERLDGAIKNVAFEIRQSWNTIPAWLQPYTNLGAQAKGGREMTVVGRASISRWVVDEILEAFFHPCLDAKLSAQLKEIEHNIRRFAPPPQSVEEDDALSAKVCTWRLTTLDAIHNQINGAQAAQNRQMVSEDLVNKLVTNLEHHLHQPAPGGLLKGCQMIVEIAVGLASNLPMESRDVRVWYPLPGEAFDSKFMKGEGGLPPLTNPADSDPNQMEVDQGDANSSNATANSSSAQVAGNQNGAAGLGNANGESGDAGKDEHPQSRAGIAGLPRKDKSSSGGGSGGVLGRARRALQGSQQQQPVQPQQQPGQQSGQAQQASQAPPSPGGAGATKAEERKEPDRVRVAGFMAVEVRGKSILVKAPVWL